MIYRIKKFLGSSKFAMDISYYIFAGILLLNALFIYLELPVIVIFLYLIIYMLENIRRPITVDYLGDIMKKEQRATMLSVEAQIKSILVFIFAPLFGIIADFNIAILFVVIGVIMIITNLVFIRGDGIKTLNSSNQQNPQLK